MLYFSISSVYQNMKILDVCTRPHKIWHALGRKNQSTGTCLPSCTTKNEKRFGMHHVYNGALQQGAYPALGDHSPEVPMRVGAAVMTFVCRADNGPQKHLKQQCVHAYVCASVFDRAYTRTFKTMTCICCTLKRASMRIHLHVCDPVHIMHADMTQV
jgi:hypothetical protein